MGPLIKASGTVTKNTAKKITTKAGPYVDEAVKGAKKLFSSRSVKEAAEEIVEEVTEKAPQLLDDLVNTADESGKAIGEVVEEVAEKSGKDGVVRHYGHLEDSKSVGPGKNFTAKQKSQIIEENMKRNDGVVRSDLSGEELVKSQKSQKGVTPSQKEWQIDHIEPKSKGGSNSFENAQVLSREENRLKSDK